MSKIITYTEILAFITSLVAWPVIRSTTYLKLFPILLFVIVSVESFTTFFETNYYFNAVIYNIQKPIEILLYMLILLLALQRPVFKRVVIAFMIVYVPLVVFSSLYLTEPNSINAIAYSSGAVIIIISILMKLYEMLERPAELSFLKDPFFYMLFACMLFNVGTLPYFTMGNWMYFTMNRKDIVQLMVYTMSIFNFILYGTYTIAFLWMIRMRGYS